MMKRMMYVRCGMVLFMAGGLIPGGVRGELISNLLVNASFESGAGAGFIDAWMGDGDHEFREQASVYGYTLGEGTFPNGLYALKLFSGAADVYQSGLPVRGGVAYVVGGKFYHSSTQDVIDSSELSLRGFLRVEWLEVDQHLIREDYTPNHNGSMPADLWLPIEAVFLAPSNAVSARVHVQTHIDQGGGSIFADQVFFGEKK